MLVTEHTACQNQWLIDLRRISDQMQCELGDKLRFILHEQFEKGNV